MRELVAYAAKSPPQRPAGLAGRAYGSYLWEKRVEEQGQDHGIRELLDRSIRSDGQAALEGPVGQDAARDIELAPFNLEEA